MKKHSRLSAILPVLFLAITVSSCTGISTELSHRGLVGAMGIDYRGGAYTVTLICFNSDTTGDTQSFNAEYVYGTGMDLHMAFQDASDSYSKKLFYGHNTLLILGRELCENKISETAIYLSQNKETRLNISVFMADTTAEAMMRLHTSDEAHISGSIEKLLNVNTDGLDIKVQLFQIMQQIPEKGICGILPVLRATVMESKGSAQADDDSPVYDITADSIAIFDDNRLVSYASGRLMKAIFLMQDRVLSLNLAVKTELGSMAYGKLTRTSVFIGMQNNTEIDVISVHQIGSVAVTGKSDLHDDSGIDTLKILFETEVSNLLRSAYDYAKEEIKVDLFRIQWYMTRDRSWKEAELWVQQDGIPSAQFSCELTIAG